MSNSHNNLKKNIFRFLFICSTILMTYACTMIYNSESYLRNYDRFVTRTENNYTEYNEAEWENTEARYEEFNTTFYKRVYQDLTPKDQQAIGKLKARYNAIKMKYKFNLLKRDVKDGIEQLKGVLEKDSVD